MNFSTLNFPLIFKHQLSCWLLSHSHTHTLTQKCVLIAFLLFVASQKQKHKFVNEGKKENYVDVVAKRKLLTLSVVVS